MTEKEKSEKIAKLKKLVKPEYEKIKCWTHGWPHAESVAKTAGQLAEMEGEDPFYFEIAGYCHDLGRVEEQELGPVLRTPPGNLGHAEYSVKPAKKFLDRIGITGTVRNQIIGAVGVHSVKKYSGPNKIASVLQDADRKDGLGEWGVIRVAVFNAEVDIKESELKNGFEFVIRKIENILEKDATTMERFLIGLSHTLQWYEDLLNTKSAEKLLKDDYLYAKEFYKKISEMK